jgi:hypothetical protein
MRFRLVVLALGASAAVAGAGLAGKAQAEPEVLVKCDGPGAAQRFTRDTGWKPTPNPDRSVIITRENGKLAMELAGDNPITSRAVMALPQHAITTFRVLGHNGVQNFHVVQGLYSGKPVLKHTIFGAKDGSGVFHQEDYTLDNCSVVAADVAVEKEVVGPPAKP